MENPFNGNSEFGPNIVLHLRDEYKIESVIETGTYKGSTTIWFAENFTNVVTIDTNVIYLNQCKGSFSKFKNITAVCGNSGKELGKYIPKEGFVLFYLDAHWGSYWPLLDELKIISEKCKDRAVIVIDDFQVPDRTDISFDSYNGVPLNWEFVESGVTACYSPGGFEKTIYVPPPGKEPSRGRLIVRPSHSSE